MPAVSPKPMHNPAPLLKIAGLSRSQIERLSAYWITSIQELLATAEVTNGREHLKTVLRIDDRSLEALLQRAQEAIPPERGPGRSLEDAAMAAEYSSGALVPPPVMRASLRYETVPFIGDLPEVVDYTRELPPARDQGARGTCVAHAAAAVREFLEIEYLKKVQPDVDVESVNLSEQFIYWWCKEKDNLPHVNGTYPHLGMACLEAVGAPEEAMWPYSDQLREDDQGQGPPPPQALENAWRYRVKHVIRLDPKRVEDIKAALANGKAVLFSIPIFNSWYESRTTRRHGKINMPFPDEQANGAHAMAMVGYVDDASAPGGGYFLIRNSWAPWGFDSPQGTGTGAIPYAFIAEHNMEAATGERAPLADVFIRSSVTDTGQTPVPAGGVNSPDIWVRHHDDGGTTHQMPRFGESNTIYIRALNKGPGLARGVRANIFQAPVSPSNWPEDWVEIGEVGFPEIVEGGSAIASLSWTPDSPGNYCFLARLSSPEDPVQHEWSVRRDNNLAQKNLVILNLKPGEASEFSFQMHSLPDQASLMDLFVDRKRFPRGRVALRMAERQRLRGHIKLQEDEAKLMKLIAKATDKEHVSVKITTDAQSRPGDSGEIVFTQHYGKLLVGSLLVQVHTI